MTQARYTWTQHSGGVILTEVSSGREVFLQPGDDAGQFLDEVERTNALYTDEDLISEYFA